MRHEVDTSRADPGRARVLSSRERATLLAIARAVMPTGRRFAGADARSVDKVEQFLALSPPAMVTGYRGVILALEAAALLRHRAALANLDDSAVLGLLESWR